MTPDATVTPSKITIKARLIELRLTTVSGFDLSAMNNYRWSPQCAKVNLYEEPHEVLSKPFECCAVDLNERLQRALRESPEKGSDGTIDYDDVWEFEALENVEIIKDGRVERNVAFWFEGELDEATVFSSLPPKVASTFDDDDDNIEKTVNGGGKREGIRRKSYSRVLQRWRPVPRRRSGEERRYHASRHQTRLDANILRIFATANARTSRTHPFLALRHAQRFWSKRRVRESDKTRRRAQEARERLLRGARRRGGQWDLIHVCRARWVLTTCTPANRTVTCATSEKKPCA